MNCSKDELIYSLSFVQSAKKEWDKLAPVIKKQFANKLKERLYSPKIASAKLKGMHGCYKIKLRTSGYRLVYEVLDDKVVVMVIAVGKRDRNKVYIEARKRLGI